MTILFQRNDIAMAITKYDQFDFLIDIVPREEIKPATTTKTEVTRGAAVNSDQVHYYFQLAQQHQQALNANTDNSNTTQVSCTCEFPDVLYQLPKQLIYLV